MAKLLLVEDTVVNRELLARRFARFDGIDVICACDGQEGIEMAVSEQPDIILMDMGLPVVDGWTATMRLKLDPRTMDIPVIAVTAYAFRSDQVKCQEHGCDDFMAKPLDFKILKQKIDHWLAVPEDTIHANAVRARMTYKWDNRLERDPLQHALG